jgi:hypothetical protein
MRFDFSVDLGTTPEGSSRPENIHNPTFANTNSLFELTQLVMKEVIAGAYSRWFVTSIGGIPKRVAVQSDGWSASIVPTDH